MPRIAGVNIPENKKILTALTYIHGIGFPSAEKILKEAKIEPEMRTSKLQTEDISKLRKAIEENYKIEGDLRREVMVSIKRLKDINCYRGHRHIKKLPVRGQRTKTNSRTARGNVRKTVGSGRKPPPTPK